MAGNEKYDANEAEPRWGKYWEDNGIFRFDKDNPGEIFSIDTPPPTVSGKMHLGHAFSYSQQDFIARFQRMRGRNVFYPFGTDDNGLPTKLLIEKSKGVKASKMDRKEFVKLVLKTLDEELRPKYISDWRRIGMSCDFEMFYTTINKHCLKISQKSFIDLYNMGREYRAEAPAMYCPSCQTAISQVECQDKEIDSFFNDIVFKVDGDDLIIATTRPELLPACVAVFYHPSDKRYQKYQGMMATVPLFGFEVPILADERADPEKGTGIVMCCTFGDSTDAEWQKAHNLPIKVAIGRDGTMTSLADKYEGLSIEAARKAIIADMKEQGLLINQKPIKHTVNVHERCGTPIEFVHSKQWFIRYLDLKDEMLRWGNELNWFPNHMKNRYDNWVKGLQWDWCISRQVPYGVPFPVWYCADCDEIMIARIEDLPVDPLSDKAPLDKCPKCGSTRIVPETDTINTWATSSLTPQIAASLVPDIYDKLYPMTLRPQAHDIISFWLFNTVIKSRLHNGINPWRDCVISGWALDPHGKKMSKSKGNIVEPQPMVDKYSADALRFWAGGCKLGEDLPFMEKDLVTGTKFVTKLWNAVRFGFMHLEDYDGSRPELDAADKWILNKLNRIIKEGTENFERYEYSKVKSDVEVFFWQSLCDYYLEIIKDRLYNPDRRGTLSRKAAQYTLYNVLLTCLKLIAPITPFITEEIYHNHFRKFEEDKGISAKSIHLTSWPEQFVGVDDQTASEAGEYMVAIIGAARRAKSEAKKSLKEPIAQIIIECNEKKQLIIEHVLEDIKATTHAELIVFGQGGTETIAEDVKIHVQF